MSEFTNRISRESGVLAIQKLRGLLLSNKKIIPASSGRVYMFIKPALLSSSLSATAASILEMTDWSVLKNCTSAVNSNCLFVWEAADFSLSGEEQDINPKHIKNNKYLYI